MGAPQNLLEKKIAATALVGAGSLAVTGFIKHADSFHLAPATFRVGHHKNHRQINCLKISRKLFHVEHFDVDTEEIYFK